MSTKVNYRRKKNLNYFSIKSEIKQIFFIHQFSTVKCTFFKIKDYILFLRYFAVKAGTELLLHLLVLDPVPPQPPDLGQRGDGEQRAGGVGPPLRQAGQLTGQVDRS